MPQSKNFAWHRCKMQSLAPLQSARTLQLSQLFGKLRLLASDIFSGKSMTQSTIVTSWVVVIQLFQLLSGCVITLTS